MPRVETLQRSGRSLLVQFDDGSALRCDRDFPLGRRLRPGQEVEPAILARVRRQAARHDAERLALRWLALRARSRAALRRRLREHGIGEEVVAETLDALSERGLIDDRAFAEDWVERRLRTQPRSRRLLRTELRRQGVEPGLAEELTVSIDDEATALALAVEQRGRFAEEAWEAYRERAGRLLRRRGFAGDASERALRAAWAPPAPVGQG
jgi:regulatory protein